MGKPIFIIAEAGVNHNGSLELAKKLIDAASLAGADAVKFQTFKTENVMAHYAPKAKYQQQNDPNSLSQYDMVKKLELSYENFRELFAYCQNKNIQFLSTAFDCESVTFLNTLGIETFKIPSGEITNYPYICAIGKLKKKVFLSTGMATTTEIQQTLDLLVQNGTPKSNITVLQCHTDYPTKMEDVNLQAMLTIKDLFNVEVGYSDHTLGIAIPIAATALGATVIEKHFTLDRNMPGPDHKASLEPNELIDMVREIRNVEKALGNGEKKPTSSELINREVARKSIVAKNDIVSGDLFTELNLAVKRPGNGISPMNWPDIIGKKAPKNFKKDEIISL